MKYLIAVLSLLLVTGCVEDVSTLNQIHLKSSAEVSEQTPDTQVNPSPTPSYTPPAIIKIDPFTSSDKVTFLYSESVNTGMVYLNFRSLYSYGRIERDYYFVYMNSENESFGCKTSFIKIEDSQTNYEYPRITISQIVQSVNPTFQHTLTFSSYLNTGWQYWNYDSQDECHTAKGTWELQINKQAYNIMRKL